MKILSIDVGGTHVKILLSGEKEKRETSSGGEFTPQQMVAAVKELAKGWEYDVVSIGFPAPIKNNKPAAEPYNLGKGWTTFDYEKALGCPVKIINDAAMQALGSYKGGRMLFLGLGTGLGSAYISDGMLLPMELGHLPYRKKTFEDYVGIKGLKHSGSRKWKKHVFETVQHLAAALLPEYVVLGGGNVKKLKEDLPPLCVEGENTNAFLGGFRLWEGSQVENPAASGKPARRTAKK